MDTPSIKAVFFDIDGTLVSFKTHKVSSRVVTALKKLQKRGIKIFVATGRGKDGLAVIKDIPFDGYITLNGQFCFTQERIIYENFIARNELAILLDELKKEPFPCGFTMKNGKVFNYRDQRVDAIHAITHNDNQPAGDVSHVLDEKVYQCMCFIDEKKEKQLLAKMKNCTSGRWHPLFTDISPLGGTKQNGIDQFLKYYDIDLSETMAFGDGGNDVAMLKHVAYAVAMGNGEEAVKEIADYVTDSVDEDGVVTALHHFHLLS